MGTMGGDGPVPVVSGLLGPAGAPTGPRVAGGGLVTGGAPVVLVPLVARGDLGVLHILHGPAHTRQNQTRVRNDRDVWVHRTSAGCKSLICSSKKSSLWLAEGRRKSQSNVWLCV